LFDINFTQVFVSFIVLLCSLTVHELAHAWTADRLGDPTARLLGRVSFNPIVHADPIGTVLFPLLALAGGFPLIGWAKPVPVNLSRLGRGRRDYVLVSAAGPLSNLVLAAIAAVVLRGALVGAGTMGARSVWAPLVMLAGGAIHLNVLLAVFNLLPIPPLDGGNVVGGLLPQPMGERFDAVRPYGFMLIYALMLTGTLGSMVTAPYSLLLSWLL
jgi:Zn-dependent protease